VEFGVEFLGRLKPSSYGWLWVESACCDSGSIGVAVIFFVRDDWFAGNGTLALISGVVKIDFCEGFLMIVGLGASEMLLFGSLGLTETGEGWAWI